MDNYFTLYFLVERPLCSSLSESSAASSRRTERLELLSPLGDSQPADIIPRWDIVPTAYFGENDQRKRCMAISWGEKAPVQ